jgi:hypothetical protein
MIGCFYLIALFTIIQSLNDILCDIEDLKVILSHQDYPTCVNRYVKEISRLDSGKLNSLISERTSRGSKIWNISYRFYLIKCKQFICSESDQASVFVTWYEIRTGQLLLRVLAGDLNYKATAFSSIPHLNRGVM